MAAPARRAEPPQLDLVEEARAGFTRAQAMRQLADARAAQLREEEGGLVKHLDDLQVLWTERAERLRVVREDIAQQEAAGDALSDAMDSFDTVLRVNGIPREDAAGRVTDATGAVQIVKEPE